MAGHSPIGVSRDGSVGVVGEDDLHKGLHLPKPGLPNVQGLSPQGLPLSRVGPRSALLDAHPSTPLGAGSPSWGAARAGIEHPPIGYEAHQILACFGSGRPSQMRRQGPLDVQQKPLDNDGWAAGMAPEGRMRYDSHEISDHLGQPSCKNVPNNKMADHGIAFPCLPGESKAVSTASMTVLCMSEALAMSEPYSRKSEGECWRE